MLLTPSIGRIQVLSSSMRRLYSTGTCCYCWTSSSMGEESFQHKNQQCIHWMLSLLCEFYLGVGWSGAVWGQWQQQECQWGLGPEPRLGLARDAAPHLAACSLHGDQAPDIAPSLGLPLPLRHSALCCSAPCWAGGARRCRYCTGIPGWASWPRTGVPQHCLVGPRDLLQAGQNYFTVFCLPLVDKHSIE